MFVAILFALSLDVLMLLTIPAIYFFWEEGKDLPRGPLLIVIGSALFAICLTAVLGLFYRRGVGRERERSTVPARSKRGLAFGITLLVTGLPAAGLAILVSLYNVLPEAADTAKYSKFVVDGTLAVEKLEKELESERDRAPDPRFGKNPQNAVYIRDDLDRARGKLELWSNHLRIAQAAHFWGGLLIALGVLYAILCVALAVKNLRLAAGLGLRK